MTKHNTTSPQPTFPFLRILSTLSTKPIQISLQPLQFHHLTSCAHIRIIPTNHISTHAIFRSRAAARVKEGGCARCLARPRFYPRARSPSRARGAPNFQRFLSLLGGGGGGGLSREEKCARMSAAGGDCVVYTLLYV